MFSRITSQLGLTSAAPAEPKKKLTSTIDQRIQWTAAATLHESSQSQSEPVVIRHAALVINPDEEYCPSAPRPQLKQRSDSPFVSVRVSSTWPIDEKPLTEVLLTSQLDESQVDTMERSSFHQKPPPFWLLEEYLDESVTSLMEGLLDESEPTALDEGPAPQIQGI